jgi:hypothetical protein
VLAAEELPILYGVRPDLVGAPDSAGGESRRCDKRFTAGVLLDEVCRPGIDALVQVGAL